MFPMLMPRPSDFAMLQVSGVTDAHDCAAFTAPAARRRSAASVFFMPRIFLWLGAPMSAHPHLAAKSYSFGLGGLAPGGARQRTRSRRAQETALRGESRGGIACGLAGHRLPRAPKSTTR